MQTQSVNPEELFTSAIKDLGGAMHRREFHSAFSRLEEAANAGHVEALYELAVRTERFNENKEPSFNWCLKAAELGHPKAQKHVATMYRKGIGTPVNTSQADYWRHKADSPSH